MVVVVFIGSVLGAGLLRNALQDSVTSDRIQDHLVARLLAESALEELGLEVSRRASTAGDSIYTQVTERVVGAGNALLAITRGSIFLAMSSHSPRTPFRGCSGSPSSSGPARQCV